MPKQRLAYNPPLEDNYQEKLDTFLQTAHEELSQHGIPISQAHPREIAPDIWMDRGFYRLEEAFHYRDATVTLGSMHNYQKPGIFPALEFASTQPLENTVYAFIAGLANKNPDYGRLDHYGFREKTEPPSPEIFYTLPLAALHLSPHTRHRLEKAGITHVRQLAIMTEQDLLNRKPLGRKALRELQEELARKHPDLRLGMHSKNRNKR